MGRKGVSKRKPKTKSGPVSKSDINNGPAASGTRPVESMPAASATRGRENLPSESNKTQKKR